MTRMGYISVHEAIRAARKAHGLSQSELAAASGAGRVTISRLEAGAGQDFRLGTLSRLCSALDLELTARPRGAAPTHEAALVRERERSRRLDSRRRHAALAAALLALPSDEAAGLVRQARANVDRWERDQLCSEHYVTRWRERLDGPVRTVALRLLEHGDWTDALLQNSPWSFALEPSAA